MSLIPSSSAARLAPDATLVVRIAEQLNGIYDETVAITDRQRTQGSIATDGTTPRILASTSGAPTIVANAGRWWVRLTSAAARVVRDAGGRFPADQLFSAAQSVPPTQLGRPLQSYSFRVPVRVDTQGTAAIEVGISDDNGILTLLGTNRAFVWTSDAARNGGRWTPRFRRVAAGGITDGPDSGVASSLVTSLGIRYTEGIPPRIEWLLNGAPFFIIEGDANMPATNGVGNLLGCAYGVGTPAGTIVDLADGVYEVRSVGV